MYEKSYRGSVISGYLSGMAINITLGVIFLIDPTKVYGWWGGLWQGILFVSHWILSFFKDGVFLRASNRTFAYNVFFWISIISTIYTYIRMIVNIIILIKRRNS